MPREVRVQVNHSDLHADSTSLAAAIRLLTGDPELVIVDFRVLRLIMGDLAGLIVLDSVSDPEFHGLTVPVPGFDRSEPDESFAWDDESPCE